MTRVRDFSDPFAVQLLPPWPRRALRGLDWLFKRHPMLKERLVVGSRGALDLVALRSRAIDISWTEAYRTDVRQLVILGAGLDSRPYRLQELEGVSVFEVDHPATQCFKRERARALRSGAASHTYVAIDFRRDDLGRALRGAGVRADETSHLIWEGVTHYLPHSITAATLAALATMATAGSQLVVTYAEPGMGKDASLMRDWILRLAGEPHVGLLERAHMARLLEDAGWRVRSDEGLDDLAHRFTDGITDPAFRLRERVVLAEKPGSSRSR